VDDGAPADHAGLLKGDRVVAIEGHPVTDGIALIVAIRTHRPGETISLSIVRDGKERSVRVKLDAEVG
jgi:putative serine protease PepD